MVKLRKSGFVVGDNLEFRPVPGGGFCLVGEIQCYSRIVVQVVKTLQLVEGSEGPDPLIRTETYAYNASVRGFGTITRSDNSHPHPGHADNHHRHDYNWQTDEPLSNGITWVGEDNWPTLGQFIEDLAEWYWANQADLPPAEEVGQIGIWKFGSNLGDD